MAAVDNRKLEKTSTPGIFRRHTSTCKRDGRCRCQYVVRWKERGQARKQTFGRFDDARQFKASLDSGSTTRRPLSSICLGEYYEPWLKRYRGRTARGLEDSTRREYEISFRLHILPLPIAGLKMRDVGAPDVRDWLGELEDRGCSPTTIRKAKAALAVLLASAVEDGDLASNPAAGVRYVPSARAKRAHIKRTRRKLTAADVTAILAAMDERWQAFFVLLVQSGVRIGELLGLTWRHVHLGDDPHIDVAEQFYRGQRKQLKTDASTGKVPLSPTLAAWLADLRPVDAAPDSPVFPSMTGTPLTYSNMYNRVLRPALRDAGIARNVGTEDAPEWDYQGVAFHAFRKACGSLLFARGKTLKQVQGWLRHSQLTTTMNIYIDQVDDGLGGADVWDEILDGATWGHRGATGPPEAAANRRSTENLEIVSVQEEHEQP
jgi:integrase